MLIALRSNFEYHCSAELYGIFYISFVINQHQLKTVNI